MKINNKNLLVVAGSGRNVGKTEFICRVIEKFCLRTEIYALKVSAIYPDEGIYHGSHEDNEIEDRLFEESRRDLGKDTSRMLRAGAKRVYYLRGDRSDIQDGYAEFISRIPSNAVIICESNSLHEVVEPALIVMVRSETGSVKPRAQALLSKRVVEVISDGKSGFPELEKITYIEGDGWALNRDITSKE